MVWEVPNIIILEPIITVFENIYRVQHSLDAMVWEVLNLRLRMRNPSRDRLNHVLHSHSIGPADSSVGRESDCSPEGGRFEPDLVDIKTSLTQLVECQPHELKAVGSIPKRGTSRFALIFLIRLLFNLDLWSSIHMFANDRFSFLKFVP